MSKSTELAQRPDAALSAEDIELQKLLGEYASEGLENVTQDDVRIPRLAILQPTSPLSSEDGFSAGHIANLQTSVSYGREVDFVPLFYWTSAVHGMTGDLKSKITPCSLGAACPDAKWVNNAPPLCTQFKNILLLPLGKGGSLKERVLEATPAVFAAKRTALKGTNEFLTMASMLRVNGKPAPLFASVYHLRTDKVDGEKGVFFVPKITRVELVSDVELFKYLRQLYIDMKQVSDRLATEVIEQEGEDQGHERKVREAYVSAGIPEEGDIPF